MFSLLLCVCVYTSYTRCCASLLSCVQLFVTPWTVAHQGPLSVGFCRQEYWSELPCCPPGNLPNPWIEPMSPTLQADSLLSEPPGKPLLQDHFSSVTHSCLTLLRPHGLQHARLSCPSPTPGAYSNSCSLSHWCHPTISSSVVPFSSHLQSFSASGSFPVSKFFTSSGQSIGVSALTSVLPMNIRDWFPLGWTRPLKESSPIPQFKSINSLVLSFLYSPTFKSLHDYWKNHILD